jgi:GTPase SAR1 family protein
MNKSFELEPSLYEKLNVVKLGCDQPLTTKHEIRKPFQNSNFFYAIVGAPGSGKSTFMFSMLTTKSKADRIYYRVFKDILYCCPTNSQMSVKDNPLSSLETVYDKLSNDIKDKIIDNKKQYDEDKDKNYQQLLIIDDCSSDLKQLQNINLLSELSKNRRHLNLSLIILVQYLRDLPRSIRSQPSAVIIFKPANGLDYDIIRKEFINMPNVQFMELMDFVFKEKHDQLFIDRNNNDLFKNLMRIIINK